MFGRAVFEVTEAKEWDFEAEKIKRNIKNQISIFVYAKGQLISE